MVCAFRPIDGNLSGGLIQEPAMRGVRSSMPMTDVANSGKFLTCAAEDDQGRVTVL